MIKTNFVDYFRFVQNINYSVKITIKLTMFILFNNRKLLRNFYNLLISDQIIDWRG